MSAGTGAHGFPFRRLLACAGWAALAALLAPAPAQAVGTAFTYQGRLTDAGSPATGSYDLQFALFDAAGGGAQVGTTLTRDDVVVTNGLFTVSLDFGVVFTGSKRWLELAVRPGAGTGAYTTLAGRQELTPAPNAMFSSVSPWSGISGKPAGFADDVDNDSGGDITAVAAGTGLTGGGTAGAVSLGVDLSGSGSAATVARSDHDHFAQSWSGSSMNGLSVTNATGAAVRGVSNGTAGGSTGVYGEASGNQGFGVHGNASSTTAGSFPFGVLGTSALGVGVFGQSTSGIGLAGFTTSATGFTTGVGGTSQSSDGMGVWGQATSTTGFAIGVRGETASTGGIGVWGYATPTEAVGSATGVEGRSDSPVGTGVHGFAAAGTGANVGVRGVTLSPAGFGGYFLNTTGGPALGVSAGGIRFNDGTTQTTAGTGDITAVTAGTGLTGGGTTGGVTVSANLAGSGAATTIARSDHDHLGQAWTGETGLTVTTTVGTPSIASVKGVGFIGVIGESEEGVSGKGVLGRNNATFGAAEGVSGSSASPLGRGVVGFATSSSGTNYGIYGRTNSAAGYAGYFEGNVGIPGNSRLTFGSTTRQMVDLWGGQYGIGVQGGVHYFRTGPPGGMFTWFLGGSHSDTQNDPGPGGVRQMRLDGAGNLFVRGAVSPGGADFAEMLLAEPGLEAGDVLAIGPDGQLTLATTPYQDSLAGVYSTKPGLVGGAADGESTEGKVPLAVAGVVPVKVTAENGPVKPGDLLTSSSTAGHAMRASRERVVVGVVIGKALESLQSPTGVIRALVVLQ